MPCPTPDRWKEHLEGTVVGGEQAALTEHLDSCADCRKTLETIAGSDSLLAVARQAGADTDTSATALHEVLDKYRTNPLETVAESAGGRDESLAFLASPAQLGHLGRLAHYEIHEVIGRGGFGVVLKAFDEKLHRIVAIKVLSPALASSGSARKRFIREARAAAAVSHDHVVGIFAVEEDHSPPYIVMQCVAGQSLQEKLDRQGPLPLVEILRIGMQTAEGLAAAHKQGKIHRDIKPANILLENGVERVKITDFGLARAVDDASVTQSGVIAGTPMYMSPEQAEGVNVDHRSDLFSLGSMLYVMCTGRPPFRATGTMAVLKRVIEEKPTSVREINAEMPEWLEEIIARLHAKKPDDRFQTAKEVAELLGQHLADVQAGRSDTRRAEGRQAPGEAPVITAPPTPVSPAHSLAVFDLALFWLSLACLSGMAACAWPPLAVLGLLVVLLAWGDLHGARHNPAWVPRAGWRWSVAGWPLRWAVVYAVLAFLIVAPLVALAASSHDYRLNWGSFDGPDKQTAALLFIALAATFLVTLALAAYRYRAARVRIVTAVLLTTVVFGALACWDLTIRDYRWKGILFSGVHGANLVMVALASTFLLGLAMAFRFPSGRARLGAAAAFCTAAIAAVLFWSWQSEPVLLRFDIEHPWAVVTLTSKDREWKFFKADQQRNSRETFLAGRYRLEVRVDGEVVEKADLELAPGEHFEKAIVYWAHLEIHNPAGDEVVLRKSREIQEPVTVFTTWEKKAKVKARAGHYLWDLKPRDGRPAASGAVFLMPDKVAVLRFPEVKQGTAKTNDPGWVRLFNGNDLAGWSVFVNPTSWKAEAGILHGSGAPSMLLSEKTSYSHFHLRMDVKSNRAARAILLLRSDKDNPGFNVCLGSSIRLPQTFLPGEIEKADFLGKFVEPVADLAQPDEWNRLEVIARGPRVIVKVNGKVAADWTDDAWPKRGGQIGLSQRGPSGPFQIRNFEIRELSPEEPGWIQLFNGKNLSGWKTHPIQPGNWRVEGKDLVSSDVPGYLFSERGDFEHFHLRAEMCVTKGGDSGIFFRAPYDLQPAGKPGESLFAPSGGYDADVSWSGSARPGRIKGLAEVAEEIAGPDQWMTLEIIAQGNHLITRINGKTAVDVVDANSAFKRGHLALQAFRATTSVRFKKIEIKELASEEPGWVKLFNGKDLHDWSAAGDEQMSTWQVGDGVLKVSGNTKGFLRTQQMFQSFVFECECRLPAIPKGPPQLAGGLYLHMLPPFKSLPPPALSIGIVPGGQGTAANTPAAPPPPFPPPPPFKSASVDWRAFKLGEWNRLRVISRPGKFEIALNDVVIESRTDHTPAAGYFGINPAGTGLHYRNLRLKELPPEEPGWVKLFNGKDLAGWQTQAPQLWRVADGSVSAAAGISDKAILRSVAAHYRDFHLKLEAKFDTGAGGLITIRDQSADPADPAKKRCLAIYIDSKHQPFRTGAISLWNSRGGALSTLQEKELVKSDEWFTLEIIAKGNRVRSLVNGALAAELIDPDWSTSTGFLSIFPAGNKGELHIKNVAIKELPAEEPGWVSLFNGKDLDGWKKAGTWTVAKGNLVGTSPTGDLISMRDDFENFHLRATARVSKFGNSGIYFRGKPGSKGYEAQILHDYPSKTDYLTGSLFGIKAAEKLSIAPDEWFDMEIIANGSRVIIKVNGKITVDVEDHKFRKGHLALQAMTDHVVKAATVVEFKTIEIKELPATENAWIPLFNGNDLDGWTDGPAGKPAEAANQFKVEDRTLVSGGGLNAFLRTIKAYDNYELSAEFRCPNPFASQQQSGVLFHMQGKGDDASSAYFLPLTNPFRDAVVIRGDAKARWQGEKGATWDHRPGDQWNQLLVRCQGDSIELTINGKLIGRLADCDLRHGFIGLHARRNVLHVRNLKVRRTDVTVPPVEAGWARLFNGKDLDGWNRGKEPSGEWKVQDGNLVGKGHQAWLLSDRKDFKDFHLRMKAKYVGGMAQLILRGNGERSNAGYFVYLNNGKGDLNTGAMNTAVDFKSYNPPVKVERTKPGEWFDLEIIARGKHFQTFVNGEKALDWTDPAPKNVTQGELRFYIMGKDAELHIKSIDIKELPPDKTGWVPFFNNKDLTGWEGDTRARSWRDGMRAKDDRLTHSCGNNHHG